MEHIIDTYCGLCCETCEYRESANCGGCIATKGKPFHGSCEVADCAISKNRRFCGECGEFPCEILKRYSNDPEHGDNGERIKRCQEIKLALVAEARDGLEPLSYCGFHCDYCPFTQWCGGCRSGYNCCSFATLYDDGVCPNVSCCKEHGFEGCWECPELQCCEKGYYSRKEEFFAKASALFIGKHGRDAYVRLLKASREAHPEDLQLFDKAGSVENALAEMEKYI